MARDELKALLAPGRLGVMLLPNRMVMPPMGTGFAEEDGTVSDRLVAYHAARAGAGLTIVESTLAGAPNARPRFKQLRLDDDRHIPGLARIAAIVHSRGARAAIQLSHSGWIDPARLSGAGNQEPVSCTSLGVAELRALVADFASAARRAQQAGFDGVEIHGAHGTLLAGFLSPATNKRDDRYGGDATGRARLLMEILRAIREVVSPDIAVWPRLNALELGRAEGVQLGEAILVAKLGAEAGADAVHVTAFGYGDPVLWHSTPRLRGMLLPLAAAVKRAVNVPVIAVGRLTPSLAAQAIAEGQADFASFGRGLLADADFAKKVAGGALEDIRPCLACGLCRDALSVGPVICAVNPSLGREREDLIALAAGRHKVVVVGGGPAGMEAARVAALRGRAVVLFEQEDALGGQLLPGAVPPEKEPIEDIRRYLSAQLQKLGVVVVLGQKATAELVAGERPDTVILASGALPSTPSLPGIADPRVVRAVDVLGGRAPVGQRVAVIGGELVGCETADYLAAQGRQVTVLRRGPDLATKINPTPRAVLLRRLADRGVRALTGVRYEGITADGLSIIHADGARETIAADSFVLATGGAPDDSLVEALRAVAPELHVVGDLVSPRGIREAMVEGRAAGMRV